jgi:hypothetical protein
MPTLTDYKGNEIKKKDFILVVNDYSKATQEWMIESYEDGIFLGVEAWEGDKPGSCMIDSQIAIYFPELEEIGLQDEMEGIMSYYEDDITADEMVKKLTDLGFNVMLNIDNLEDYPIG